MEPGVTGRFLVLDGPDGCGKSTQAAELARRLGQEGREILHVRDPGGTPVGERIREILLDVRHAEMGPRTEMLLYMASRAQLVTEVVMPALARGALVISERWLTSTVVYQGYAGGLDVDEIWAMGEAATGGLRPDRTLVLDVDAVVGLGRVGAEPDRMESRPREFHESVRHGFHEIVRGGRANAILVPAGSVEEVGAAVLRSVRDVL